MALNETQWSYLSRVREGELGASAVCSELSRAMPESYRADGFLELLLAIDATHRLGDSRWYELLVKRTKRHSYLFDRKRVDAQGLGKIDLWFEKHGVGEWGLELLVEMMFEDPRRPPTMEAMVRRNARRLYNGIQAISDHGLFVLRRWFDQICRENGNKMKAEDALLLSHINRHTKGLTNVSGFEQFYSEWLVSYALERNGRHQHVTAQAAEWLETEFSLCPEIGGSERRLARQLALATGKLPKGLDRFFHQETEALFAS